MKWLIGIISGFISSFIGYLIKKLGSSVVLRTIRFVFISFIAVTFFTGCVFILTYFINLWTKFRELFSTLFDYSGVSGSYGGLENHTIVSSFMALLHESGLAEALSSSSNLLIGFLSVYFSIQAYKLYMYLVNIVRQFLKDLTYIT